MKHCCLLLVIADHKKKHFMKLIMFIYLKTSTMKVNWKQIALYILRIVELVITGAAGGAMTQL